MKIKIDDREFFGVYDYEQFQIKIKLKSDSDILFFARWGKLRTDNVEKANYVKNISFETVSREGNIMNSYPLLDLNEEFVILKFDSVTINFKDI